MISPQSSSSSLTSLLRRGGNANSTVKVPSNLHTNSQSPDLENAHASAATTNGSTTKSPTPEPSDHGLTVGSGGVAGSTTPFHGVSPSVSKDHGVHTSLPLSPPPQQQHQHHHHLSLKRFIKKFKHSNNQTSHNSNLHPTSSGHSLHINKHNNNHTDAGTGGASNPFRKYGNVGRLLGSGASGAVSLITSPLDPNVIYAVKKFRPRLPNESDLDYRTKVKNEFKVGEYLTHQNLIHTIELIKESQSKFLSESSYYIVMEYCPYDFFNLVMLGLMDRQELACYFRQIIEGVGYLHEHGLAHRDLKLDNCVVNSKGILKLIDFGLAVQFQRDRVKGAPASEELVDDDHRLIRARGIVGLDPYLAPEVLEPSNFGYDPRLVDVWSVAIIYCCMVLKRFPWKIPQESDPSYKAYAGIEDKPSSPTTGTPASVAVPSTEAQVTVLTSLTPLTSAPVSVSSASTAPTSSNSTPSASKLPPRGPDRLLRILPTASRPLIKKMLAISPKDRYFITDVKKDDFFLSIDFCHFNTAGEFIAGKDHTHHLVTEDDLRKINEEKEKLKALKGAGVA